MNYLSDPNLPPGCRWLPGEREDEDGEVYPGITESDIGESACAELKKNYSDFKIRGNDEKYIASDCVRDADIDSISTGIFNIFPQGNGCFDVFWGWKAIFHGNGDEAQGIIDGCDISGNWDSGEFGWYVKGADTFRVHLDYDEKEDHVHLAKKVWDKFVTERKHVESEANLCREMFNNIQKDDDA